MGEGVTSHNVEQMETMVGEILKNGDAFQALVTNSGL